MTTTQLPPINTVPTLPTLARATILDLLFEPSTPLHTLSVTLLSTDTFPTYTALITAVGSQLATLFNSALESDQKWLDAILSAHPRLGEKKVESELSRREQEAMQKASSGGGDSEEVVKKLAVLNQRYEVVFPGLRYV